MVSGPALSGSVASDGSRREPRAGVVGAYLDAHLATDPVRPADAADDELHQPAPNATDRDGGWTSRRKAAR